MSMARTEHSGEAKNQEQGMDWKLVVIAVLAILLVASLSLKGAGKSPAPAKVSAAGGNATKALDAYLLAFGENRTMEGLRSMKREVDLRILGIQIENEPLVLLTVISDSNCNNCSTDGVIAVSRQLFPKLEVDGVIDYNSTGGRLIAKRYGITLLPAYIFSDTVEQAANFYRVQPDLIKVGADYVLDPQVTGASFPAYG